MSHKFRDKVSRFKQCENDLAGKLNEFEDVFKMLTEMKQTFEVEKNKFFSEKQTIEEELQKKIAEFKN